MLLQTSAPSQRVISNNEPSQFNPKHSECRLAGHRSAKPHHQTPFIFSNESYISHDFIPISSTYDLLVQSFPKKGRCCRKLLQDSDREIVRESEGGGNFDGNANEAQKERRLRLLLYPLPILPSLSSLPHREGRQRAPGVRDGHARSPEPRSSEVSPVSGQVDAAPSSPE